MAKLSKFAEKAKSLAERSTSARQDIANDVQDVEAASAAGNAYFKV